MLLYSCDAGKTTVDNFPEILAEEYEENFEYDPQEITTEMTMSWSGAPNDWFINDNGNPVA